MTLLHNYGVIKGINFLIENFLEDGFNMDELWTKLIIEKNGNNGWVWI
jgi:hypothetical protein